MSSLANLNSKISKNNSADESSPSFADQTFYYEAENPENIIHSTSDVTLPEIEIMTAFSIATDSL